MDSDAKLRTASLQTGWKRAQKIQDEGGRQQRVDAERENRSNASDSLHEKRRVEAGRGEGRGVV